MASQFKQPYQFSYWQKSLWLVLLCVVVWLLATLVPLGLAQMGMQGTILGWPSVFALAAFGVPLVYLTIIAVYSFVMDRFDRQHGQDEDRLNHSDQRQSDQVASRKGP